MSFLLIATEIKLIPIYPRRQTRLITISLLCYLKKHKNALEIIWSEGELSIYIVETLRDT